MDNGDHACGLRPLIDAMLYGRRPTFAAHTERKQSWLKLP